MPVTTWPLSAAPRWAGLLGIMLVCLHTLGMVATAEAGVAERERFLAAEAALEAGERARFETLAATLVDYPLHPYLRFAALKVDLEHVDDLQVLDFLHLHQGTPLARRLRHRWLLELGRSARWRTFLEHYRGSSDTRLACYEVRALMETGTRAVAFERVPALWLHGKSQPSECDPVFAAWRRAGHLSTALVWQRVALAMDAGKPGLARYLKRFLPEPRRRLVDLWVSVRERPARVRDASLFVGTGRLGSEIRRWGMHRLARLDARTAIEIWSELETVAGFSTDEAYAVERQIGLSLAYDHQPDAGARLAALPAAHVDARVLEWRILSALRAGDWATVLELIPRLDEDERTDERWRYWEARANEALERSAAARRGYEALAGQRHYYAFLAADRLSLPYQFAHQSLDFAEHELAPFRRLPAVQRARELLLLERWTDARREWLALLEGRPSDEDRARLALVAARWGWHGRAIVTIASTPYRDDLSLRFPTPHADLIAAEARRNGIDPAWVFAVVRQESAFIADARSSAGALGLMQIMPSTGRHIAGQLDDSRFTTRQLLEPTLNVRYGAWYLSHLLNRADGNPIIATAGYNAGPRRVSSWRPPTGRMDADVWIETIPFTETRKYVRRVFAYTAIYERNLGITVTRMSDRFKPILAIDD